VLILLVLTSITLITLDARGNGSGVTRTVRDAARDSMAPVQSAVDDALEPIDDWIDGVTRSADIKQENRVLRRELAQARGDAATARTALRENEQLRKIAKLDVARNLDGVTAQVVAASPGNFEKTIALDKGTDDGVMEGQPVVAGDGLVGRVVEASRRRATVRLLTDPQSGVSVRLEGSNALALANGRSGSELLRLDVFDRDVKVKRGDIVSTSGIDISTYPANIPVARVESVRRTPGALDRTILLRPLVDIGRASFVRALRWPEPGSGG
jgi:rod shape-determining protein MreC